MLSEQQIRGNHNPGAGGWPTIRYFNKETGYEGGNYEKVTDDAMCTELGNDEHMTNYIERYGKTSLCSVASGDGCNDRQKEYIEKMIAGGQEKVAKNLRRLSKMSGEKMKPELMEWISQRLAVLKQLWSGEEEAWKQEL